MARSPVFGPALRPGSVPGDDRPCDGSLDQADEILRHAEIKHNHAHAPVPAERERGLVHDLQVAANRLVVADPVETHGVFVAVGVLVVDPVDGGAFEQGVAVE